MPSQQTREIERKQVAGSPGQYRSIIKFTQHTARYPTTPAAKMPDQQRTTTTTGLADLAEELVSNISIKLGSDDVFAFRLTCKSLERKSFHEFAVEYFSDKSFMFSTESLKVLANIAANERLRGQLHHIYFVPMLFSERALNCSLGSECLWKPTVRHSEAYRGYVEDQTSLKRSGRDFDMLAQAFNQLTALHGLTFADMLANMPSSTDFAGLAKAMRRTNTNLINGPNSPKDKEYYQHKNAVWKTVMRALAASNLTTLTQLRTDLCVHKNALSIPGSLALDLSTLDGLHNSFKGLKQLRLQISSHRLNTTHSQEDDGDHVVKRGVVMSAWAVMMPSLEELSLHFSYSPSSTFLSHSFMKKIDLKKLTVLKLSSLYTNAQWLGLIIRSLVAVKDLQLTWINLAMGNWIPVLEHIQKLKVLDHLHLMYLHEAGRKTYFLAQPEQDQADPEDPFGLGDDVGQIPYSDEEDNDSDNDNASMPDLQPHTDGALEGTLNEKSDAGSNSDNMPNLEPLLPAPLPSSDFVLTQPTTSPTQHKSEPQGATNDTDTGPQVGTHSNEDHTPPDLSPFGLGEGRGHYICLHGSQIREQIPTFIKEYNVADDGGDDGIGPPAAFLNTLAQVFGVAPTNVAGNAQIGSATLAFPGPLPPPQPPAGGGAGAGGTQNAGSAGAGGAGGNVNFAVGTLPLPVVWPNIPPGATTFSNAAQAGVALSAYGVAAANDQSAGNQTGAGGTGVGAGQGGGQNAGVQSAVGTGADDVEDQSECSDEEGGEEFDDEDEGGDEAEE